MLLWKNEHVFSPCTAGLCLQWRPFSGFIFNFRKPYSPLATSHCVELFLFFLPLFQREEKKKRTPHICQITYHRETAISFKKRHRSQTIVLGQGTHSTSLGTLQIYRWFRTHPPGRKRLVPGHPRKHQDGFGI